MALSSGPQAQLGAACGVGGCDAGEHGERGGHTRAGEVIGFIADKLGHLLERPRLCPLHHAAPPFANVIISGRCRWPAPVSLRGMQVSLEEPFAPPGQRWVPLSPRLRAMRRALLVGFTGLVGLGAVVPAAVAHPALAPLPLVLAGTVIAWGWVVIGRNYLSWGYAERADDLLVRKGWLFRQLVVVPYGRMQFVDVTAGPLERKLGLATLQLHTAAAATDATIPGLTPEEAARLRDGLAELGEARSAGL